MKSLKLFPLAVCVVIIGFILLGISIRNRQPAQIFPATIKRDCAPWDGSAFLVSIPYSAGSMINISIWQAPELKLPVTFSFPEDSMTHGNATYLVRFSYSVQLSGTVFFWRVEQGRPVAGWFDLHTEAGQPLRGKIKAEWRNEAVYCG
jgi:hypothetical protein